MKVMILGYSGCGKSTLAKAFSDTYNIPVLYLDTVYWMADWNVRPLDEQTRIVDDFLSQNCDWVIDGNYSKLRYEYRLKEASRIIIMNFNRFSCLMRVLKRYFKYRNKTRFSVAEGCPEKIDFEFIMWILFSGRTKSKREKFRKIAEEYSDKVTVIRNQHELNTFYKTL